MKMTNKKWALIGIPVVLLALGTAGVSIASVLPLALLLACPLMMLGMHGGHGSHGNGHGTPEKTSPQLPERES